ncbi:MAG: type III-B CRISPR module RAMP protein Cmr1 [Acidobacteria bacterium]|nr:type III-B CRISPR module RAMP protein Cmr1 [Acidobacteriota bacterium]
MRKPPKDENGNGTPPDILPPHDPNIITQKREYELITPLFGGGVEPGEADPVTVIRGTEVRGHLRFWWRATRGGRFNGDLAEMKKKEDEIWGAASTAKNPAPSQVQITVTCKDEGSLDHPFERNQKARQGSLAPAYAAFPLQPSEEESKQLLKNNGETKVVRAEVKFIVQISFKPEHRKEVEAALWAWETFGGIGARTRRGFGALRLVSNEERTLGEDKWREIDADPPKTTGVVKQWIERKFSEPEFDIKGQWHKDVPNLSTVLTHKNLKIVKAQIEVRGKAGKERSSGAKFTTDYTAQGVWVYLINKLKKFRQARYDKDGGRDEPNDYGLSQWPEANEIRRRHNPTEEAKAAAVIKKFPRAKLGLPINFHFPLPRHLNTPDVELRGTTSNRRASPLILRPLVCADGNAIGLVVVLAPTALPPDSLQLVGLPDSSQPIETDLSKSEAIEITPLYREPDILKAFLEFVMQVKGGQSHAH